MLKSTVAAILLSKSNGQSPYIVLDIVRSNGKYSSGTVILYPTQINAIEAREDYLYVEYDCTSDEQPFHTGKWCVGVIEMYIDYDSIAMMMLEQDKPQVD